MTPAERLQRSRILAEDARPLKLRTLVDELLVLGQVAEGEPFVARAVVATAPVEVCDLGLVLVRCTRAADASAMSLSALWR